jgi:hypothetical protein
MALAMTAGSATAALAGDYGPWHDGGWHGRAYIVYVSPVYTVYVSRPRVVAITEDGPWWGYSDDYPRYVDYDGPRGYRHHHRGYHRHHHHRHHYED